MEKVYKLKNGKKIGIYHFLWSLLLLLLPSVNVNAQTYCAAANTDANGLGSYMSNVTYGTINNTTGNVYATNGYTYFPTQTTTVILGSTQPLSVTISTGTNYPGAIVSVWFDWNQDGTFAASEWTQVSTNVLAGATATVSITVPLTASQGTTRMRVRSRGSGNQNGSGDACLSMGSGDTEDYDITVSAGAPCTSLPVASLPTTGTITVAPPTTLCVSGNVTMTATLGSALPVASGFSYVWERSVNGGTTWTLEGTTTVGSYTTTVPVTVNNTLFRYKLMCLTSDVLTSSNSVPIVVSNPGTPTATNGTRCGPGSVPLSAVAPAGATLNWYAAAVGGAPIGSGANFNTNYLTNTTTFYVGATSGSTAATPQIGTGTLVPPTYSAGGPFNNYYRAEVTQMLYTATELIAAGGGAGTVNSVAFNCISIPIQNGSSTPTSLPNYRISIATVPAATTTLAWQPAANFTQVYTNTSFNPTVGWNVFSLTTPFIWDGVSNIVIQVCYDQTSPSYSGGLAQGDHQYTAATGRMLYNASDVVASGCGQIGTSTSTYLPNVRFGMVLGCSGPRVPAIATITSGSAVTKTAAPVVCNNTITPISVTLPTNGQYVPYKFYPNTNLFTDAAATTPYTGTAATTVYFRSTTSGNHTIYAIGGDTTIAGAATSCSRADTFKIWVQPATNTIKAMPDTICVSGTTKLTLQTDTNFYPGSVQWQESTNGGTTYTNIAGANGVSYTTPTLTAARYYRAVISAGAATCNTIVKQVLVVTPILAAVQGGGHCGPGPVTMTATPGTNAVIRWYENPTGGQPLAQGNSYTTPSINTTTTYYVSAGTGAPPSQPTWVGTGTSSNTTPNPYYTGWWGSKNQFLIRASEMLAVGLSPGPINSISFQTTGSFAMNLTNYTIKMGTTTLTAMPAAYQTGLTTVFTTASYTPTLGLNTHTLTTPFVWDGVSNIIIETCYNNSAYSSGFSVVSSSYSYNATYYGYGDIATVCSGTPTYNYTSTSRPNIRFDIPSGCETVRQPVLATINPFPIVDLGTDLDTCVDMGLSFTVDAAPQPNNATYQWDNGATTSTRLVNQSGVYSVTVTNQFGCATSDTLNILIKDNPVVDLAASGLNLCEGGTKILDAGPDGENGGTYYWSTGATSRTINVAAAGTYIVYVTNTEGCLKVDTAVIIVSGQMPDIDGISSTPTSPTQFTFSAVNPQHVVEYIWIIGNDTVNTAGIPTLSSYQFPGNGNYWVKLLTNSICGQTADSIMVTIIGVGINDINNSLNVKVYPNPTRGEAITLETEGDIRISEVSIYNIIGQEVYADRKVKGNDNKYEVRLGSHLAPGVYNIRMQTNKGLVNRKMEILK